MEALRKLIETRPKNYRNHARIAKGIDKLFEIERKRREIPIKFKGALKQLLLDRNER